MVLRKHTLIACLAALGLGSHLLARYVFKVETNFANTPLWLTLALGGTPLCWDLFKHAMKREFGSDLLAGISMITSILLGEYLAGAVIVLMLSGGESLESYAVSQASSVLQALAKRMPAVVHLKEGIQLRDIDASSLAIGDHVVIYPHEICPVDGLVIEGHGTMDESFLTGEPYRMSKTPGSTVLSGAINGESALTVEAQREVKDSRYAKIIKVMELSSQSRPHLRRLGDQLGAIYTPTAIAIGLIAWSISGDPIRFLAVMVVATPCPLLIGIPVAIIGAVSLAAKRSIIVRDPAILEKLSSCRTIIFDKTGTLTYGQPHLDEQILGSEFALPFVLQKAAALEKYSKHPLANAIVEAAKATNLVSVEATSISERPGEGLRGIINNHEVLITSRNAVAKHWPSMTELLPPRSAGLECIVVIDQKYAATYRFRDIPRPDGKSFIQHLGPRHNVRKVILLSGDRQEEVAYLAKMVGVEEIYAEKSPEQKLAIVQQETRRAPTLYVGDGINDAPSLMAATVGLAFGHNSDITSEAAGAVVMDSSLQKVDELLHIGARMRRIALQSAVGGMALSMIGMIAAMLGYLTPVAGAMCQELIDVFAVINALRAAFRPRFLTDYLLESNASNSIQS
jgi:heavy metal translocating P-type ATPase